MHCMRSNSVFPIKTGRSLNLLDETPESSQEHPHKSRRTLMSLQEYEIARGSPNQLEMKPDSPALAPEQSPVPHQTRQMAGIPLGNSRDSLRHPSQVYRNTSFSTGNRGKLHALHIVSGSELIVRILLKRQANFPQAPQEEPSLSNRYVRGTLSLLPQVERIPRCPDWKEGWISLQWLEWRLVFHLTR